MNQEPTSENQHPEPIRTLFARQHTTIFPKMGVFLAGPTPPNGEMPSGWRRKVINFLKADPRLSPSMVVVSPEPETGNWGDIDSNKHNTKLEDVLNKQIPWEWQYLNLCDITAFWLPTYWTKEASQNFPANIGPTSRWEFGFFLQEYLKNPEKRKFIIGSPEDVESVKWAKLITDVYDLPWHFLPVNKKHQLVADSFMKAIADTLVEQEWKY